MQRLLTIFFIIFLLTTLGVQFSVKNNHAWVEKLSQALITDTAKTCAKDPQICTIKQLCDEATDENGRLKNYRYSVHSRLVTSRGFTCKTKVKTTNFGPNDIHKKKFIKTNQCEKCNLSGINLKGWKITGAKLPGTNLKGADLSGAILQHADLRFAYFKGANLDSTSLEFANLSNSNLKNTSIKGANLQNSLLEYANLKGADLYDANLSFANLKGAKLNGTRLEFANLSNSNLSRANLKGANLWGATLLDADLSSANLTGANLRFADFKGANLKGANFKDAILCKTKMPDGKVVNIGPSIISRLIYIVRGC